VTRRRWVFLGLALTLAAACTSTTVALTRDGNEAAAVGDSPVLTPSSAAPRSTVAATTTTTLAPLPVPDAPPADPYEAVPVTQIGAIYIPKIGLQHAIYEGVWLTVLDEGPGHWPNSALPGERGNTVFPGHRVTHSHPFLDLDQLAPGDQIIFQMPDADDVYEVTETMIVKPTDMWVIDQTEEPTVTLIACHPKHSAAQRIVVKGKLVASIPKAAPGARTS
jgi:sortase A